MQKGHQRRSRQLMPFFRPESLADARIRRFPCAAAQFLLKQRSGLRGMIMAAMIYARTPLPPSTQNSTQPTRTSAGSMPKYSAMPPQTPSTILFSSDLYSLLLISLSSLYENPVP